ncbi:hypothetical protein HQ590_09085 [bacterium]|nr:hypothetical protein [bacterium]
MAVGLLLLTGLAPARAAVEPVCWFGDNMVLQRDIKVPVWGWADPGETVTVSFRKQVVKVTAGTNGYWKAVLAPLKAGGPDDLVISGSSKVTYQNVLVGDVWVCGGQSNMWRPFVHVDRKKPPEQWVLRPGPDLAHFPKEDPGLDRIRLFHAGHNGSADPGLDIPRAPTWGPFERTNMNKDVCPESWRACSRESLRNFSRLGFFFGQAQIDGNEIRINFDHVGGGLTLGQGLFSRTDTVLSQADDANAPFEISAGDGQWVKADARIDGEEVVVSAPGVANPKHAAYGMNHVNPDQTPIKTTFFNKEGFPASPFDTPTSTGPATPGTGR